MNGFGNVGRNGSTYSKGGRSVSIYESIRQARMLNGSGSGSKSTILHKDWNRKESSK